MMKESKIQSDIIKALEKSGWLVVKIIQTNQNGWPDLMALRQGKAVFIEVKRPGNKARDLQQYRLDKIALQGFEALVATSVQDIHHLTQ